MDGIIRVRALQRSRHRLVHGERERVLLVRSVHPDGADAVGIGDDHMLGHQVYPILSTSTATASLGSSITVGVRPGATLPRWAAKKRAVASASATKQPTRFLSSMPLQLSNSRALPHWSQRNVSIAIAASVGRVTMNRCPSSTICSRAFGMSRARMRPLIGGTRGSSSPISTKVGCRSDGSQGRLVHPVIDRSWYK